MALSSPSMAQYQWNLNGNSGTNPSIHYFGTSDSQAPVIKISWVQEEKMPEKPTEQRGR